MLNASDHYGMVRLRAMCERFLASRVSFENAAYTLTLADQHHATGLRDSALQQFIYRHSAKIVDTDGWKHLQQANPQLANEVLLDVARTDRAARGQAAPR